VRGCGCGWVCGRGEGGEQCACTSACEYVCARMLVRACVARANLFGRGYMYACVSVWHAPCDCVGLLSSAIHKTRIARVCDTHTTSSASVTRPSRLDISLPHTH